MYPIKYLLNEIILAEMCYFSESSKQQQILEIKIRSFSFIQTQKHYTLNYISKNNSIKSIRVKKIDYLKINNQVIKQPKILSWLESLKINCTIENLSESTPKKNEIPINYNINWIKDKKVVVTGNPYDNKDCMFPSIEKLGGIPIQAISGKTDILLTFGDCSENQKYKQAQEWGIHIIDIEQFIELYEKQFNYKLNLYF